MQAKLLKAFAEVTGLRAEPAHAALQRWTYAQTSHALGQSHVWDTSAWGWALVATGAWGTAWKTPSSLAWNWHWP